MRADLAACLFFMIASLTTGASAEVIHSKSYSYFRVAGNSARELDAELSRRGPQVESTGLRHPGATRMKFSGTLTYKDSGQRCEIESVKIELDTRITLPRWTGARKSGSKLRMIWRTLAQDIKRHEEHHAEIALEYARKLERALLTLSPRSNCARMRKAADATSEKVLARHDDAQAAFDTKEAASFERRMSHALEHQPSR